MQAVMLGLETCLGLETVSRPIWQVLVLVLVLVSWAKVLVLVLVLRAKVLVLVLVLVQKVLLTSLVYRQYVV